MRVVAHIFALEDGKDLLKSGIDGFAHGVRDHDVDEEYLTILKQHPKTWLGPNLPPRPMSPQEAAAEIDWLTDTFPPSQVKRMRDQLARAGGRGTGSAASSDAFGSSAAT